jgi:hypothetical protein
MKTLLLFSFLLPTLLFGQIINHFSQQDSKWNVAKTYTAATQEHPSFVATTTTVYGYQGDSTINGETWSKMYSTSDSLFQNNLVFEGLTRVENDLILYRNSNNPVDTLYNFGLSVGDSVLYDFNGTPEWLYLELIENIQIDGQTYRKFNFTEPSLMGFFHLGEEWIEGIGSIHGPLFPHTPTLFSEEMPDSMFLTCTYANSQDLYQSPKYSNCYVNITLGIENQEAINFSIYPNPVSSILTIESSQKLNCDIEIYDVNGKFVHSVKANGETTTLDVSDFENGVYFLHFKGNQQMAAKRFVVKK